LLGDGDAQAGLAGAAGADQCDEADAAGDEGERLGDLALAVDQGGGLRGQAAGAPCAGGARVGRPCGLSGRKGTAAD
jgi:hypothetical protein